MRAMYRRGEPVSVIARAFNINPRYIYDIAKRTTYTVRLVLPAIPRPPHKRLSAKLTEETAQAAYDEVVRGELNKTQIARKYGVSNTAISNLCAGLTFKRIKR